MDYKVVLFYETEFDASHRLPWHKGACANIHGHTYRVEMQVEGVPLGDTGMVCDYGTLKTIVKGALPDHQDLNKKVNSTFPTVENTIEYVEQKLMEALPLHVGLVRLKIYEGARKGATLEREHLQHLFRAFFGIEAVVEREEMEDAYTYS